MVISKHSGGNSEIIKVARELFNDGAEAFRNSIKDDIEVCLERSGKKGFVFFIDDLDRIQPSLAVQILDVLQNLFVIEKCVFILAIDYNVVAKGLQEKFAGRADEREYRSYFDKIIQLPIRMPVEHYNIGNLLENRLIDSRYFNPIELSASLNTVEIDAPAEVDARGDADPSTIELLKSMVRLSIGYNPRSVKRLTYLLDFIRIKNDKQRELDAKEGDGNKGYDFDYISVRIMCFGVVCIQMAYPGVYQMLQKNANFLDWREENSNTSNAGDEWIPVRSVIAKRDDAQRERVEDIVLLLQLIAQCARESLEREMKKVLELVAAAVGGVAPEQEPEMDEEGFFLYLASGNKVSPISRKRLRVFLRQLKAVFKNEQNEPLLYFKYSKDGVEVYAERERVRRLLKWRVDLGYSRLKYTVGDENKEKELQPLDYLRKSKTDGEKDVWEKLLEAYNRVMPEKLDADFVEKHWVDPLSAPTSEPNDAPPAA